MSRTVRVIKSEVVYKLPRLPQRIDGPEMKPLLLYLFGIPDDDRPHVYRRMMEQMPEDVYDYVHTKVERTASGMKKRMSRALRDLRKHPFDGDVWNWRLGGIDDANIYDIAESVPITGNEHREDNQVPALGIQHPYQTNMIELSKHDRDTI